MPAGQAASATPAAEAAELLIVDDQPALRVWEQRVLEAQRYACAEAADIPQARAALAAGRFELALLDVNLPSGSGIELLSEIRVEHPGTSVLMVTGEDDLMLATTAIALGAHGYLVKPIRTGELLINVANALHRRRRETELLRRLETLESGRDEAERSCPACWRPAPGRSTRSACWRGRPSTVSSAWPSSGTPRPAATSSGWAGTASSSGAARAREQMVLAPAPRQRAARCRQGGDPGGGAHRRRRRRV